MTTDRLWVEVPATFGHDSFALVRDALHDADVEFDSATRHADVGPDGASTVHLVSLFRDHARVGARVIRDALELEDPAQALPYSGACPSCDAIVDDAWECASCGLGFRPQGDPHDPFFVFLREQGAFPDVRLGEARRTGPPPTPTVARVLEIVWPQRASPGRRVFGILTGIAMLPALVIVGVLCLPFLPFALLARRRLREEVGAGSRIEA